MSQDLERVHTINLGKVLLSPNNQRAKRAINMVKEYVARHMKTEEIKIEESLSHQIWKRGIRHPPRKIRVKMTKTDEGFVLVSPYEEEIEEAVKPTPEKKTPEVKEKPEPETKEVETTEEVKEKPKVEALKTKEKKSKPKESKAKEQKAKEPKPKAKESKTKPKESKTDSGKKAKPKKKSK
jgi:large subunit ribosomal protein L31e